jgi:hypothetical protein
MKVVVLEALVAAVLAKALEINADAAAALEAIVKVGPLEVAAATEVDAPAAATGEEVLEAAAGEETLEAAAAVSSGGGGDK